MADITPQQALQRLIENREIFQDEMRELMRQIMRGEVSQTLIAALIAGLRVKKESIGEITGAAVAMRELAVRLPLPAKDAAGHEVREHLIDIVGTGGDGAFSFNISTASMFVVAAAGARVAKHGGRSVSSRSGSADVLEVLGAVIDLEPWQVTECLLETGIGFMYAPHYHPAMKQVASLRRELAIRSLFNILGPLTNPADAPNVLLGVFHPDLVGIQVRVLKRLGIQHAMVVWGEDGIDEISIGAPTLVSELIDGEIKEYWIKPQDFGLAVADKSVLEVTAAEQSRQVLTEVLRGQRGPASDVVAFNAGAALYVAGVVPSLAQGIVLAQKTLANGAAHAKMQDFLAATQRLSTAPDS